MADTLTREAILAELRAAWPLQWVLDELHTCRVGAECSWWHACGRIGEHVRVSVRRSIATDQPGVSILVTRLREDGSCGIHEVRGWGPTLAEALEDMRQSAAVVMGMALDLARSLEMGGGRG